MSFPAGSEAAPAKPAAGAVPSFAHTELGAPYEPPLSPDDPEWPLHLPATNVDGKDQGTADSWIPRDAKLVRLTGRHPLNCEPKMHDVLAAGFITPPSLHYVRNHGPVPRIRWDEHCLQINGLVDRQMTLTMDELVAMPSTTLPVTLICCGNRRKEENMLKKTMGFHWGPGAVSTSYWTGVRLCDLLKHVGAKGPKEGGKHVCFVGPQGELKAGDGTYGTSIQMGKAMDPANDILIAYKQNGRWLTPDHGFPVRTVIPGVIGGRTIKWLCTITVQEQESNNYYHYMDNRVLPAHVDQELAAKEGWWYKPEYIINNMNVNSACAHPWHDEVAMIRDQMFTVKGYAYAGSGHAIIRCEISLDDGKSWRVANIRRGFEPNDYGKHWCCVHWDIEVPVLDAFLSKEMRMRAWDEAQNTQPSLMPWTLLGQMNNCEYRLMLHPFKDDKGELGVRFQHPAPIKVGKLGHVGWREEEFLRNQALEAAGIFTKEGPLPPINELAAAPKASAAAPKPPPGAAKEFTMDEVAAHTSPESAWFVHEGKVYDATRFLEEHPGGPDSILVSSGADATEDFNAIHSKKARIMLEDYCIGELAANEPGADQKPSANGTATANGSSLVTLNPRERVPLKLMERIAVSHNTRVFRFALPSPEHILGLPTGKHVLVYARVNGELVARAYTPVSSDKDKGRLDLLIKVYFPNVHPAFPEGGKMSQTLDRMKTGDTILVKGPVGHFTYEGKGTYTNGKNKGKASKLSALAGGTGITPILQVMEAILRDKEDQTCMSLIFANQTEADILARNRLDKCAQEFPEQFKVYHVLSKAPPGWPQGHGRVTDEMMRERFFPAGEDSLALMCGPPGLLNFVGTPGFEKMGYSVERIVSF